MTLRIETHDDRADGSLLPPLYSRAIGSRTGIVSEFYVSNPARSDPKTCLTIPDTADIAALVGLDGDLDLGLSGKGENLSDSLASALGETIERYCMCWPRESTLEYGSYEEIAATHRVPEWEYLDVFTPDQRDRVLEPLTKGTTMPWTIGTDLRTGESVAVPAELVWMRVGPLESIPQRFPGSSSGCAAGTGTVDAIVRSLYEVIERDAFVRTWCLQRPPTRLDIDETHPAAAHIDRVRTAAIEPHVFEHDSPIDIPTVGAALRNEREELPTFITGGAAALDRTRAIAGALDEVAQGWPYTTHLATTHDLDSVDATAATDNFDENVLYYGLPENFDEVSFLFEGPIEPIDTADVCEHKPTGDAGEGSQSRKRELKQLLAALAEIDATPIAFDLTTVDAAQLGIAVTRVVVPELVPLTPPAILPRGHPAFDDRVITEKPHPYP